MGVEAIVTIRGRGHPSHTGARSSQWATRTVAPKYNGIIDS